jgi:hypothetical protein
MKQQSVPTRRYPVLQQSLTGPRQTNSYVFYVVSEIQGRAIFLCEQSILTEGAFVTQLPSSAGIPV